jgi:short subunit dehydrogenase-like uncharacterized protein
MCTTTHNSQTTPSNIHAPVEKDGNAITPTSNQKFALTAVLGVPFWLTVLLPVTVMYQVAKAVVDAISPKNNESEITLDSGYKVDQTEIVPRPDRTYDVVVLGATGFTGRLAALHLAKTYGCTGDNVRWAIAGRSKEKLEAVKQSLADELQNPDILNIPVLVVDTSIPATLPKLVRDTRAVVTTVGPFQKYGNSVVEFCAKFGTHYADITGETKWVQTMMNQWQATAKRSGAKIIPFCGHDSIPWDLSVYKLAEMLLNKKQEDLSSVSCVNDLNSGPSGGTLETLKLALTGKGLPDLGQSHPFRATPEGRMHTEPFSKNLPFSIKRLELPWLENQYGSFFVMSVVNAKVVSWTQALRQGAPLSYSECAASPDFKTAFVSYFGTIAFFTALLNPITAFLLTKFVLPAPGQGPSMEKMTNHSYGAIYAKGVGTGGTKVESLMYFSKCIGYLETARMVVESGLSLALSEDELTAKGGGFFSPAYGLGNVLLDRLTQTGTHFTVRCCTEEEGEENQK